MHARLNPNCGWRWQYDDGTMGHFVLTAVERYAGMLSGLDPSGRRTARPQIDFDALSHDGIEWHPFADLRELVPWEGSNVRVRNVPLPGWESYPVE